MVSSRVRKKVDSKAAAAKATAKRKTLVWVTGGKGGTGKSTFARGLLDILRSLGLTVVAIDGDRENSQLFRYYQNSGTGVVKTGLAERDGGDDILEAMELGEADVILADVAAGGSQILSRLQDESMFLSIAEEMGYDITVVSVLSPIKDSINMLKEALETTDGFGVRHVAVKNLHFDEADGFALFEGSKTREQLQAAGGVVLEMRDLLPKTYSALDRANLPFSAAKEAASGLPSGDRARVRQWLTCLTDELQAHGTVFGL